MKRFFALSIVLCCVVVAMAQLRLPAFFGDHMVLQRDMPVKVWGEAAPGKRVTVELAGKKASAKADKTGHWSVSLPALQAGGPYTMVVKSGKECIAFEDVLMGEVWLCSGQSNMEWRLRDVRNADQEVAEANYPMMRSFNVAQAMEYLPQNDLKGMWQVCSSATAHDFSAVGYFFARNVHVETGVPVGFINSSWGGTDIETWMSLESISRFPQYNEQLSLLQSDGIEAFIANSQEQYRAFEQALREDVGEKEQWYLPTMDRSGWPTHKAPLEWCNDELGSLDGVVWMTYKFTLPQELLGKDAILSLACVDDSDKTWINGTFIGETHGYNVVRTYIVPAEVLAQENEIVVKVTDGGSGGGIWGNASDLYIMIDGRRISLCGEWSYQVSVSNAEYNFTHVGPNSFPSLLFNGMIHPMIGLGMRGVIWYQGCNNTNRANQYYDLFPAMINDWRARWGYEFPFYWVQLANFMQPVETPVESDWARLRDAQTATLSLPHTGQAVIIDLGEAHDIHPRNKQDVGARLARHALHNDYGMEHIYHLSPMCKQVTQENNKLIVTFDNVAEGLEVSGRYGYLCGFAVAGEDGVFHYAKALLIDKDKVAVWCDEVEKPLKVRYAWADNPDDANLYNSEGLATTPFEAEIVK